MIGADFTSTLTDQYYIDLAIERLAKSGEDFTAEDVALAAIVADSRVLSVLIARAVSDGKIERVGHTMPACSHVKPVLMFRGVA